jgi:hypothetical protein
VPNLEAGLLGKVYAFILIPYFHKRMDAGVAFTSEFPLPPSYYTEFHNSHDIKPPVISDEFNESQIYGGSVIDKVLRYDDSKKYKDLLIR